MFGQFIRAAMKHRTLKGAPMLLAAMLVGGCSGSPTQSLLASKDAATDSPAASKPDGTTRVCAAGAQVSCACPGGKTVGVQVCSAHGQGYGACAGCQMPDASSVKDANDARDDVLVLRDAGREASSADASKEAATPADASMRDAVVVDAIGRDASDAACSVGALECAGQQPEICTTPGTWQSIGTACSGTTPACLAGACVQCLPATVRCSPTYDGVETCNGIGQWGTGNGPCPCTTTSDCPAGGSCVAAACEPASVVCEYSSQCASGQLCANNQCLVECSASSPCGTGFTCTKGVCEVGASSSPCASNVECTGAAPYCVSGGCAVACTTAVQCPAGDYCDQGACTLNTSPSPDCSQSADCNAGQVCPGGYCLYPCTNSAECADLDDLTPVCVQGVCVSAAEAAPGCTAHADCAPPKDCISNSCQ